MSNGLSDLIMSAIEGAEIEDTEVVETEKVASETFVQEDVLENVGDEEIEKIASALEFLANRGMDSFIKEAAANSADVSHSNMESPNPAYAGSYGSSEKKTHHSSLASNESAQNYSATSRNQMIDPVLKQLLANADSQSIHANKTVSKGQASSSAEPKQESKQKSSDYDKKDNEDKKKLVKEALAKKLFQTQRGE